MPVNGRSWGFNVSETRSRARVVHHRNGDSSPVQASTAKGRPGRHLAAEGRRQRQPAARPGCVTCGNGEGGGPGRRPVPGPDCGSRITRPHPRASAAAAFRSCWQFPHRPHTGPDDLAAELNPHKAIWTVPAASRASADQERCLLARARAHWHVSWQRRSRRSRRLRSAAPVTLRYRRWSSLRTRTRWLCSAIWLPR